jgi:hypothetical protein
MAEDFTKYKNTKINYRQKKSSTDIQDVSWIHRKLNSQMRGNILCKQCCNSVSSIMIGFRAYVQERYNLTYLLHAAKSFLRG